MVPKFENKTLSNLCLTKPLTFNLENIALVRKGQGWIKVLIKAQATFVRAEFLVLLDRFSLNTNTIDQAQVRSLVARYSIGMA